LGTSKDIGVHFMLQSANNRRGERKRGVLHDREYQGKYELPPRNRYELQLLEFIMYTADINRTGARSSAVG
jgi:hypothetical protein